MAALTIDKLLAIWMLLSLWAVKGQELEELTPGDHIYTYRRHGLYTHHGIYIGGGHVIHFTRTGVDLTSLQSFRTEGAQLHPLHRYAYGQPLLLYCLTRPENPLHRYAYGQPLLLYCLTRPENRTTLPGPRSLDEVINKAWELYEGDSFGEYDLFNNNCEHSAAFCSTGVRASAQTALISALQQKIEEVKDWAIKILQGN